MVAQVNSTVDESIVSVVSAESHRPTYATKHHAYGETIVKPVHPIHALFSRLKNEGLLNPDRLGILTPKELEEKISQMPKESMLTSQQPAVKASDATSSPVAGPHSQQTRQSQAAVNRCSVIREKRKKSSLFEKLGALMQKVAHDSSQKVAHSSLYSIVATKLR